jgi:hypothetical protein
MITLVPISSEAMISLALISIMKVAIFWGFILLIDVKTNKAERLARLLETHCGLIKDTKRLSVLQVFL